MGVARRGPDLRVPKELAEHGQTLAGCRGRRGKSMAKIVDANVLKSGTGADALPEGLEVTERLAGQVPGMTHGLLSMRWAPPSRSMTGWPT